MFLHSGASLHGHEFSKRATKVVAPVNLRNPLLRSALSPPANRNSALLSDSPISRDNDTLAVPKRATVCAEPAAQTPNNAWRTSRELVNNPPASPSETMSGDETSIVSDTDASAASSSARRKRRSNTQTSTTYVLAHPPPKPRSKQRIIHMRPNLVLQIQQITPGLRPKPTIDVYPSFAGARSIMAPLIKRVPGIAGFKRELSGQDIMLVRSEDYASQISGSESDCDEDNIMARDLLAVLSPSKSEDKAEIIMAEGMVWTATTRSSGNSFSYEFTSVGPTGTTMTARWVRKQIVASSLPGTPTSPTPSSMKPQFSETKFTFSFLDPKSRRHPVLATLSSTSLNIPDTYTTVPQPVDRSPSTPQRDSPDSPSGSDKTQTERLSQSLEEWQKSFISVSAVWVALRHSWAPGFRPEDFMPLRTSATFQMEGSLHGRRRSLSASADSSPTPSCSEATGRRKYSIGMRQHVLRATNEVPRRATSTGAAFVQKRRAVLRENDDNQPTDDERNRIAKLNRRALSGDWTIGLPRGARESSLAELAESIKGATPPKIDSETQQTPALAPPPMPVKPRAVSAYSPLSSLSPDTGDFGLLGLSDPSTNMAQKSLEQGDAGEGTSKSRHRKWKNMTNWLRKMSGR
ncbi:hypothetical protein F4678DRAFT_28876 [Xylaria arbuscula]|nr:hypothetical protein F4678DRAFT_28876 [Xylaria arbuscula]